MKTAAFSTISLIAIMSACSGGGGGGGTTTITPVTPTPVTPTPSANPSYSTCITNGLSSSNCVNGSGQKVTIDGKVLTSSISGENATGHIYNSTYIGGTKVTPTGTIAGTSQAILGMNPLNPYKSILSMSSDKTMTTQLVSKNYTGSFSQVTFDVLGVNNGTKIGTANMNVNANAGTMSLTGDSGFAASGETLVWDGKKFNIPSTSTLGGGAAVFGNQETVGFYAGSQGTNLVTGTFGGVAN